MSSRRRPARENSDATNRYSTTQRAPNYSGDDSETLIRLLPLPLREEDEEALDELTMRHSSIH